MSYTRVLAVSRKIDPGLAIIPREECSKGVASDANIDESDWSDYSIR